MVTDGPAYRGLMDEVPPLYPREAREHWLAAYPDVVPLDVEDVNHYTIVFDPDAVARVAAVLAQD